MLRSTGSATAEYSTVSVTWPDKVRAGGAAQPLFSGRGGMAAKERKEHKANRRHEGEALGQDTGLQMVLFASLL